MTAIDDRIRLDAANARIDTAIDALLALRNLAAERPDIADDIHPGKYNSTRLNAYVGNSKYAAPHQLIADVPGRIAELAAAAARHGATLTPNTGNGYGGISAMFGPFELYIYAPLEQVADATVREVTDWQLDPRLAALRTEAAA